MIAFRLEIVIVSEELSGFFTDFISFEEIGFVYYKTVINTSKIPTASAISFLLYCQACYLFIYYRDLQSCHSQVCLKRLIDLL